MANNINIYVSNYKFKQIEVKKLLTLLQVRHWTELSSVPSNISEIILL